MYYKGKAMRKDTVLSIRVPDAVREKLGELAKSKGLTLAELIRSALSGLTWEIEFQRNIEYHRMAIKELKELEKVMRSTQRERSKVITGKAVTARRKEQLELI
jgi:predicted DNA-binding protein